MFRWVDSTEIADKWELTVKEEGANDPLEAEEVKKLEGLGTKAGALTQVGEDSKAVHLHSARQVGNPEGALCGEE